MLTCAPAYIFLLYWRSEHGLLLKTLPPGQNVKTLSKWLFLVMSDFQHLCIVNELEVRVTVLRIDIRPVPMMKINVL